MTGRKELSRLQTGIPGLDPLLDGGLLTGGVYILQGPPGAGKTLFGNQLCFRHASAGGRALYVTLLAESHTRMLQHLSRMAFFDEAAIPGRLQYLSAFKVLEEQGLEALVTLVRSVMQKHGATVLVLDGLVSAQEAAPSTRAYKKFIHELQTVAALMDCTVLLLTNSRRPAIDIYPEHTMVDGVLELTDELSHLRPRRHIRVVKQRGSNPVRGLHSVVITDAGLRVFPRLEMQLHERDRRERGQGPEGGPLMPFGVAELDEMLHGGLRSGSLTMLLGPTGSGKTLLGTQFLAGGLARGESVVYFGFYERPGSLIAKCERAGIKGFQEAVAQDRARVIWRRPVEAVVDELGDMLLREVQAVKATRLFLDGLEGFELAADFPERIPEMYAALAQELRVLGVTTVYSVETRDVGGPGVQVPITGISASTENLLLLRYVDTGGALRRLFAILKLRDSGYDPRYRELLISDEGLRLADTLSGVRGLLGGPPAPLVAPDRVAGDR